MSANGPGKGGYEDSRHEVDVLFMGPILDAVPELMYYKDTEGAYLGCNLSFCKYMGKPRAEIIGRGDHDLFPETYADSFRAMDRRVCEEGRPITREQWGKHADGRKLLYETTKAPIKDDSGKVVGLLAVSRDVTDRNAVEEALRESEQRFRLVFQNMTSGFALHEMIYDESGHGTDYRFLEMNPAFEDITGLKAPETIGRTAREIMPDLEDHWLETYGKVSSSGETATIENYSGRLGRWFQVRAFSPQSGRFAVFVNDITERKKSDELIWFQANYDSLTELPNRRLFLDRLENEIRRARRQETGLGLLFIDLDAFKEVNDRFGHDVGDKLLVESARRVAACVRDSDTVARLSGDEFTVLVSPYPGSVRIGQIARNVVNCLSSAFEIDGQVATVSGSVGISRYPDDATEPEELLKRADEAMYRAKQAGRARYVFAGDGS